MTEVELTPAPAPEGAPVPVTVATINNSGFISHILTHVREHIRPDVADARIKAENAAARVSELAPHLQVIASVVAELAKADPGIAPGRAAEAVAAAGEVARIAAELSVLPL